MAKASRVEKDVGRKSAARKEPSKKELAAKDAPAKKDSSGKKDEEYEFELPAFDEEAFVRREVQSARASFYTLGLGFAAGLIALALLASGLNFLLGWIPILGAMAFLAPILKRAGFSDEVVAPKALVGGYFMLFFTALGIWIFGANFI